MAIATAGTTTVVPERCAGIDTAVEIRAGDVTSGPFSRVGNQMHKGTDNKQTVLLGGWRGYQALAVASRVHLVVRRWEIPADNHLPSRVAVSRGQPHNF
jgi:hypothetical protein